MSSKRGKGKSRYYNKSAPRRFDPSPLIGDVDTSRENVKLFLVKMPVQLVKQFEDPSNGVVGRMRFLNNVSQSPQQSKTEPIKAEDKKAEDNPFIAQPMDMSIQKINQVAEGYIFLDKIVPPKPNPPNPTINKPTPSLKPLSSSSSKLKSLKLGGTSTALGKPVASPGRSPILSDKLTSKKYELFSHIADKDMAIFSGNSINNEKDDMRLEGIVETQYQARPVMNDEFRKLNKHRSTVMNTNSSIMSFISEREIRQAELASLRPNAANETMKEREERKRKKEESRRHLDVKDDDWKEATTAAIFKAFEIQAYYTADDLANTIAEPASRIRPFISELCQYNKAGPFAQRYELKDEFKTVAQRERKERDIEEHKLKQLEVQKKRKEERDRDREQEGSDEANKKKQRLN